MTSIQTRLCHWAFGASSHPFNLFSFAFILWLNWLFQTFIILLTSSVQPWPFKILDTTFIFCVIKKIVVLRYDEISQLGSMACVVCPYLFLYSLLCHREWAVLYFLLKASLSTSALHPKTFSFLGHLVSSITLSPGLIPHRCQCAHIPSSLKYSPPRPPNLSPALYCSMPFLPLLPKLLKRVCTSSPPIHFSIYYRVPLAPPHQRNHSYRSPIINHPLYLTQEIFLTLHLDWSLSPKDLTLLSHLVGYLRHSVYNSARHHFLHDVLTGSPNWIMWSLNFYNVLCMYSFLTVLHTGIEYNDTVQLSVDELLGSRAVHYWRSHTFSFA